MLRPKPHCSSQVHASPTQAATQEWKAYLASRFPVMLVKPAFAAPDAPLCPIADRPMRQGPTNEARLAARREVLRAVIVRVAAGGTGAPA